MNPVPMPELLDADPMTLVAAINRSFREAVNSERRHQELLTQFKDLRQDTKYLSVLLSFILAASLIVSIGFLVIATGNHKPPAATPKSSVGSPPDSPPPPLPDDRPPVAAGPGPLVAVEPVQPATASPPNPMLLPPGPNPPPGIPKKLPDGGKDPLRSISLPPIGRATPPGIPPATPAPAPLKGGC